MRTLLFIHGVGVRGDAWFTSLNLVASKAAHFLPGFQVEGCAWGDAFGARLHRGGAAIPGYASSGQPAKPLDDASRARWWLLAADPLLELRITPKETYLGEIPGRSIFRRIAALAANEAVLSTLRPWFLAEPWPGFVAAIAESAEWRSVVEALTASAPANCEKLARALTAAYQVHLREGSFPGLTGEQRDLLKQTMIDPLGGPPLGAVGDWLLQRLTGAGERRRGSLTDGTTPAVGDIIRYQSRGREVRNFIAHRVDATGASVLLTHSLGGIAAVDWLASPEYVAHCETGGRKIDTLITVGSQAPYFYEMDALVSRRYGEGLPETFPRRWLNFYDPADFLSYLAEPVFPRHARDVAVDNRQPFPESHSAYWNNATVWTAIATALGEA